MTVFTVFCCSCWLLVSVTVSIAGLLVMVSSELVVLLIVCVGINTGSALQGELTKLAKTLGLNMDTYTNFLTIQNIVKVENLLIKHVHISVTLIPTQTVWTLQCSV